MFNIRYGSGIWSITYGRKIVGYICGYVDSVFYIVEHFHIFYHRIVALQVFVWYHHNTVCLTAHNMAMYARANSGSTSPPYVGMVIAPP